MTDVLVDTSVWVDHFRRRNDSLVPLLAQDRVCMHPFILGELACGTPPDRVRTLQDLASLRPSQQATLAELLSWVEQHRLLGQGCGVVDLTLLACTLLTPGMQLWTLDQRLLRVAERFGLSYENPLH